MSERAPTKLTTLAELGEAFEFDLPRRTGPKESRGKQARRFARKKSSPPMVATRDCGLCGRKLAPGRYLCAVHVERALETSRFYRQNREPGPGRVWMTETDEKENDV